MQKIVKLRPKDLKAYRDALLEAQEGLCALCGREIPEGKAVLDHSHKTQNCRAVLHSNCNILLGKIENAQIRTGIPLEQLLDMCKGLASYLSEDYSKKPLHSTELTPLEKELKKAKKLKASSKKVETKAKYFAIIEELQKKIKDSIDYYEV